MVLYQCYVWYYIIHTFPLPFVQSKSLWAVSSRATKKGLRDLLHGGWYVIYDYSRKFKKIQHASGYRFMTSEKGTLSCKTKKQLKLQQRCVYSKITYSFFSLLLRSLFILTVQYLHFFTVVKCLAWFKAEIAGKSGLAEHREKEKRIRFCRCIFMNCIWHVFKLRAWLKSLQDLSRILVSKKYSCIISKQPHSWKNWTKSILEKNILKSHGWKISETPFLMKQMSRFNIQLFQLTLSDQSCKPTQQDRMVVRVFTGICIYV